MWQLKSSQHAVVFELSFETKDLSQNQYPQMHGNYGDSVSAHLTSTAEAHISFTDTAIHIEVILYTL